MTEDVVFFLDVDNTLLDNDYLLADLKRYIEREIGTDGAARYWQIFNTMRSELGYVDYLGALQSYRVELDIRNQDIRNNAPAIGAQIDLQSLPRIASFLLDYPFAERLYLRALEVVHHLSHFGQTVILTDGDVALQAHKIKRAGLWDAVGARVLIYVHKEKMLDEIEHLYPARHYVIIDDKPGILAALKAHWQARVTTVLPMQGHYALDPVRLANYPPADLIINEIGAMMDINLSDMIGKTAETVAQSAQVQRQQLRVKA